MNSVLSIGCFSWVLVGGDGNASQTFSLSGNTWKMVFLGHTGITRYINPAKFRKSETARVISTERVECRELVKLALGLRR